jgi:hypothetical protein
MHVIPRNMTFENLNVFRFTKLTDQFPYSLSYCSTQNRLAVFGDPNKVVLDIIDGMAGLPIVFYTASILKSSPKGEGFSPIPRRRQ